MNLLKRTNRSGLLWLTAFAGVGASLLLLTRATRALTPTPNFQRTKREGRFEIRKYPSMVVASTTVTAGRGMNEAFQRLYRFITGQNNRHEKIAMTAPVLLSRERDHGSMSFILPQGMSLENAPVPASPEVIFHRVGEGEYAVARYSGEWSEERAEIARRELEQWAAKEGLKVSQEDEMVAYYDPPWTPKFMRRNEVLLRVTE